MVLVRVLGPVDVVVDGEAVRVGSSTQRLLLASLARARGRPVSRERLIDLVWDTEPATAVKTLASHISRLRATVNVDIVASTGAGYALTVPAESIDAVAFETRIRNAESLQDLEDALRLWRGEPYESFRHRGFFVADADRLVDLYRHARQRRGGMLNDAGDHDMASAELSALVEEDPTRELAWVLLLDALCSAGRQGEATRVAHRYRSIVADRGLEVSKRFAAAEQRLYAGDRGASADGSGTGLPARIAPVVGRDDDVTRVIAALDEHRLVTLVGPGGVGKTTLALDAARVLAAGFAGGVRVAWLADVGTPAAVIPAVARAVGAPTTEPIEQSLRAHLARRELLLLVDNAEHLRDQVAPVVADLAAASEDLHILVTSRRRLGIAGEAVIDVEPLDLDASVELISQRAAAAAVDLTGREHRNDIVEICERLDRLPLALEMAATRLRSIEPGALVRHLDQWNSLLSAVGDRSGRHDTMRRVVGWSVDLLDPGTQRLLAELSTFASPFDLDAALSVASGSGGDIAGIAELVEHSLLRSDRADGERRYWMLETVRSFAAHRLASNDRADETHARFIDYHRGLMGQIAEGLAGPDEIAWARRFDEVTPNLAAAHERALERRDMDAAADLVAGTYHLVYHRLRADVGAWADTTLDRIARRHSGWLGVATVAALNALNRGDLRSVETLLAELPEQQDARRAHEVLADANLYRGDLAAAEHHSQTAARLAHRCDDSFTIAFAGASQALAAGYAGDTDRALDIVDESSITADAAGSPLVAAYLDYARAEATADRDPAAAIQILERVSVAADDAGWALLAGVARVTCGSVRARSAEPVTAIPAFERLLDHWQDHDDRIHLLTTLRNVVVLLARLGDHESAAILLGACQRDEAPPTYGAEQRRLEDARRACARALGESAATRIRDGRQMSLSDAVLVARQAFETGLRASRNAGTTR